VKTAVERSSPTKERVLKGRRYDAPTAKAALEEIATTSAAKGYIARMSRKQVTSETLTTRAAIFALVAAECQIQKFERGWEKSVASHGKHVPPLEVMLGDAWDAKDPMQIQRLFEA
jgi:hypothetical protein